MGEMGHQHQPHENTRCNTSQRYGTPDLSGNGTNPPGWYRNQTPSGLSLILQGLSFALSPVRRSVWLSLVVGQISQA